MSRRFLVAAVAAGLALVSSVASATPVTLGRTETNIDHVSFGLGGLGDEPGTFEVTGVEGPVRKAFLYWHGADLSSGGVYDNETIEFAGTSVTGVSLGDAETNCWGPGTSRAFFADVTHLVTGNGDYEISGLNAGGASHEGNGASLIVLYNDATSANDRDLVFFEGNDSDVILTGVPPGDPAGWAATLSNINYTGGSVFAEMHVGDGQSFTDASITFSGASNVVIQDTSLLWDGLSVPNEGSGRSSDSLWDLHRFDITGAFGSPGTQSVSLSGMIGTGDCHSLVVLMLELRAGSAPCGNGEVDDGEECDPAAPGNQCGGVETCINDCTCGCTSDFQCNDGNGCTLDQCETETGRCLNESDCPSGPGCNDTCDEVTDSCRECGRPFRNDLCLVNAVFVLQAALDLRSCQVCLCDVNSSSDVTASDALLILKDCAGVDVDLQCTFPD